MKFRAIVATTNKDLQGEQFSEDELRRLAETAGGKDLLFDWRVEVGKVEGAFVEGDELIVEGTIPLDLFAVPGFTVGKNGERELKICEIGLTPTPADPHLTPIELLPSPSIMEQGKPKRS